MNDVPAQEPAAPVVLVVDDNPATRYATARVLQAARFRTLEAETGGEALRLVDGGVGAIILDVHLPDINGFEVCRILRSRADTARLPVIHLSAAHVGDSDKVRGLNSGADAYITHPADPALLVATLQALVRARTAEDLMRHSEARFRAIYDQALSGICLIDTDGRLIEANPAMLAMLQRSEVDVVGRLLSDFAPPEWVGRVSQSLSMSHHGVWRGDFPLCNASGGLVHLAWSLTAHVEPGLIMGIATNISERMALSQQREQLLEREQAARGAAERVSRTKDEFIAVLSHELRTPLNAIVGWVHVLKQSNSPVHRARGLESIERNAKIQTRLISDILDVSRVDLGKLRLDLEVVNASEVVNSAVEALRSLAQEKSVHLSVNVQSALRPEVLDASRLQQVVWNLLNNSIKFSKSGDTVWVELVQDADGLRLTVQDEGQGIKPDFLPYLFDRFTQSDAASNRSHGGLGLGLSIVKHLVELHGGTVRAFSAGVGQGATFVATFPSRSLPEQATSDPASGRADRVEWAISHTSLDALTILVVEDEPEAREMVGMVLRDHSAHVLEAADCAAGLACFEQMKPDVLVSDIGLRGEDGYALIRAVRQLEQAQGLSRMPAIALTAFARQQDQELALAAGFDVHCAKPTRPRELIAAILAAMGQLHGD